MYMLLVLLEIIKCLSAAKKFRQALHSFPQNILAYTRNRSSKDRITCQLHLWTAKDARAVSPKESVRDG